MPSLELPHTAGCLVCGQDNPHGLHLSSTVDPDTDIVQTTFTPSAHHIGFENIIHGGILATVLDEIMVWSAIWACGRACVAAEMSLRFRNIAVPEHTLIASATVTQNRSRLIETSSELRSGSTLICTATGKYSPLSPDDTQAFFKTLIEDPATAAAIAKLRSHHP